MRLDHIAYRVANRKKTTDFFLDAFGYKVEDDFELLFPNKETARCYALTPPERGKYIDINFIQYFSGFTHGPVQYHASPEIFVSEGSPDSVVGKWVEARQGIGGIHHLAYEVDSVEKQMEKWIELGYAEFTTEAPMRCPGLIQCFTKPSELTGVIYEFIQRKGKGFCRENVLDLMTSTEGL